MSSTTAPEQPQPATQPYPCDRGIPNNVTSRGWHNYQSGSNGVVVCTYCGRKPRRY